MENIQSNHINISNELIAREHRAILDTYYSMVQKIRTEGPESSTEDIVIFYNEFLLEHINNEEFLFKRTEDTVDQRHLDDHLKIKELYETAFGIEPGKPNEVNPDSIVIEAAYIFELAVTDHWQNFDNGH